jgi:hypothetical protein
MVYIHSMRYAILTLLLLVTGCGMFRSHLPLDGTVCVRPGSDDTVVEATADAAQAWHDTSGGRINLNVIIADPADAACDVTVAAGLLPDASGTCYFSTGTAEIILDTIQDRGSRAWLRRIMTHELGHAMGASHSERAGDIMHTGGTAEELGYYPTDADLAQVLP